MQRAQRKKGPHADIQAALHHGSAGVDAEPCFLPLLLLLGGLWGGSRALRGGGWNRFGSTEGWGPGPGPGIGPGGPGIYGGPGMYGGPGGGGMGTWGGPGGPWNGSGSGGPGGWFGF
ncbi:hypothetical protein SAMN05421543_11641 [Alicyclobacillus macrosporangiidus]|uniref:Uncharacterized protein n=1 Tax=Alicyclobacillus macrosporangiidus TaxID=392015 RepID=A0A1I7KID0_9BACL|nr:hypothetical protein SAMN05421543_11641 [Alicyclobacillus macrosporangiidus]